MFWCDAIVYSAAIMLYTGIMCLKKQNKTHFFTNWICICFSIAITLQLSLGTRNSLEHSITQFIIFLFFFFGLFVPKLSLIIIQITFYFMSLIGTAKNSIQINTKAFGNVDRIKFHRKLSILKSHRVHNFTLASTIQSIYLSTCQNLE